MDKKIIQEKRKRGYFINAAQKIIREEGVEAVTVKKVADLAGFAPGTLYNYFKDLNELFYFCAYDFWDDCRVYIRGKLDNNAGLREKVINFSKVYCEFFMNNPNIFELIFLKDIENLKNKEPESPEIAQWLHKLLNEEGKKEGIPEEKIKLIEGLLGYSIHGILLFYIKKRSGISRDEVMKFIEDHIVYILDN